MKTILVFFISLSLFFPTLALGEIKIITHTVKQSFGGSQSPDDARIAAVAKAKREALELAGIYIESTTIIRNAQVAKDEILAFTAGVVRSEVLSQKNYTTDDSFGIEVSARVEVDTAILETELKKIIQDRMHFEQLKQARSREKDLFEKIATLERENRESGNSSEKKALLKNDFNQASQHLAAISWYEKANALFDWNSRQFTDSPRAMEYLNNSIALNPDNALAYYSRGSAYNDLRQHQQAIREYTEAIRIKPDLAEAWINRGCTYANLGQRQMAINDYNEGIRLKPNFVDAYINRGNTYLNERKYLQAIDDFKKALRLKPNYSHAWYGLTLAYGLSGNRTASNKALLELQRVDPDRAETLLGLIRKKQ